MANKEGKITSVIFHCGHDETRTGIIEEWLETEREIMLKNGSRERLTIVASKEQQEILNSITAVDYYRWLFKNGYEDLHAKYPETNEAS